MVAFDVRQSIPRMDVPEEISSTPAPAKAPFWQRAKRAAHNAIAKVVVVTKVTAAKVALAARRVVRQVRPAAVRVAALATRTWRLVLRPVLRVEMIAFGFGAFLGGLILAPAATLLITASIGGLLLALSFGAAYLETSDHWAHRALLATLEIITRAIVVLAYGLTAAVMIAGMLASVLDAFIGLASAGSAYYLARVFSSRWSRPEVIDITPNRRIKLPACTACGSTDDGPRMGLGRHKGICTECFRLLAHEQALEAARHGKLSERDLEVAIDAGAAPDKKVARAIIEQPRSKFVWITDEQRKKLSQRQNSVDDLSKIHWAEVAWWNDGRGVPHPRKWDGYVAGRVAATISYEHDRHKRGYTIQLHTTRRTVDKTFTTMTRAQEVVADELSDEAVMIGGMLANVVAKETEVTREAAPAQVVAIGK